MRPLRVSPRREWSTANHPLDYGYGPGAPLAKLVEVGGKVVMIGAVGHDGIMPT